MSSILSRWLFLLFVCATLLISFQVSLVSAQDEEEIEITDEEDAKPEGAKGGEEDEEEEEYDEADGVIRPHPDVRTVVYFPDFPDKKFEIGERVTVLVGFNNKADLTFNITAIGAHFQSPYDLSYFIQNFSIRDVGSVGGMLVDGHRQLTLDYLFAPDKSLEPIQYWLSGWVQYNASNGIEYRSTWANGTIDLIEKSQEFDIKRVFSYFLLLSGVGLIIYVALSFSPASKKKVRKNIERGTRVAPVTTDADWGTAYKPAPQARRAGSRSKIVSKKKTPVASSKLVD